MSGWKWENEYESTKAAQRRWQKCRQRALRDLQLLHPDEYHALLEAALAEEGVTQRTPRKVQA